MNTWSRNPTTRQRCAKPTSALAAALRSSNWILANFTDGKLLWPAPGVKEKVSCRKLCPWKQQCSLGPAGADALAQAVEIVFGHRIMRPVDGLQKQCLQFGWAIPVGKTPCPTWQRLIGRLALQL